MVDLNAFVPPGSELTLNEAVFINDRGEISGFGTLPNGDFHGFVMIPCGADEQGCQHDAVSMMPSVQAWRLRLAECASRIVRRLGFNVGERSSARPTGCRVYLAGA
jgi:hypothetical protein